MPDCCDVKQAVPATSALLNSLNFSLGTADGDESQQGKIWRSPFSKEGYVARRICFDKSFTPPLYYFDPHLDQITLVSIAAVVVLAMGRGKWEP